MSKDMLGSVVRAAVGVPQNRMDVLAKIASAMAADNPAGEAWHARFKAQLKEGLPSIESVPPATFERNEHGHMVFTITGLHLTGAEEIERLQSADYRVGDYARQMLTSERDDGYDAKHHLVAGQKYRIVLLPGKHIARDSNRTTSNLRAEAEKFGYGKPLAGIVPRIRETVSDRQIEEMGFGYIAALHEPITVAVGNPSVLDASRSGGGRWLSSGWGRPVLQWYGFGAFAFLLHAS
ncbi:hypothetical protein KGQ72_02515 [Patescibacteria group bacterium]|nr:hypothetical protein [Patescibacteria group bacterium]